MTGRPLHPSTIRPLCGCSSSCPQAGQYPQEWELGMWRCSTIAQSSLCPDHVRIDGGEGCLKLMRGHEVVCKSERSAGLLQRIDHLLQDVRAVVSDLLQHWVGILLQLPTLLLTQLQLQFQLRRKGGGRERDRGRNNELAYFSSPSISLEAIKTSLIPVKSKIWQSTERKMEGEKETGYKRERKHQREGLLCYLLQSHLV